MRCARVAACAVLSSVALAATGCGGSASGTDPRSLLSQAKGVVDGTGSVHFVLASTGVHGGGSLITGGDGDIARPDRLRGRFKISIAGFGVSLEVLAGAGRFYVKAPFQTSYAATDPATYGVGNPAQLLDPKRGLSSLLPAMTQPRLLSRIRVGGDVVDQVVGDVPGASVPVLPDDNPAVPVTVTVAIVAGSHQVRQVTLVGPFASKQLSTYTVTLTGYGEAVRVSLPGG